MEHPPLSQSRFQFTRAGLLTHGSRLDRYLPIPLPEHPLPEQQNSGTPVGQLPVHSGATVTDSHRLPY